MVREDYKEPQEIIDILELVKMKRFGKLFVESLAVIDLEEGIGDGFAYDSNIWMCRQRKKGVMKVVESIEV